MDKVTTHIGGGTGLFMTDPFADPTACALGLRLKGLLVL